jgi:hypothetical protein
MRAPTFRFSITNVLLVVVAVCASLACYSIGHRNGQQQAFATYVNSVVSAAITDPQWRHLSADANHLTNVAIQPTARGNGQIAFTGDIVNTSGKTVGAATGTLGAYAKDSTINVDYYEGGRSEFTPRYFAGK